MEDEKFKIDFSQAPNVIQRQILSLPKEEQEYWIEQWLAQPQIITDLDGKVKRRAEFLKTPTAINRGNKPNAEKHWQD